MLTKQYTAVPSETEALYANQTKKIKADEYDNFKVDTGNLPRSPFLLLFYYYYIAR